MKKVEKMQKSRKRGIRMSSDRVAFNAVSYTHLTLPTKLEV